MREHGTDRASAAIAYARRAYDQDGLAEPCEGQRAAALDLAERTWDRTHHELVGCHSTLVAGRHDAPMEYGRIVGESTGVAGGRGSGSGDVTGRVMDAVSDVVDQVASQPPEILIAIAVAALVALVLLRR